MNIAVCLSGSPRNPHFALESINKISKTGNVKLFIHTWKFEDISEVQNQRNSKNLEENIKFLIQNFNYESLLIQKFDSIKDYFNEYKITSKVNKIQWPELTTYLPMFFSIFKSNELKHSFECANSMHFDLVYRMRFESRIINEESLLRESPMQNTVIIPDPSRDHGGVNDQFAYGDSESMNKYSLLFPNLCNMPGDYWNPESILLSYLRKQNLNILRSNLQVEIYD